MATDAHFWQLNRCSCTSLQAVTLLVLIRTKVVPIRPLFEIFVLEDGPKDGH